MLLRSMLGEQQTPCNDTLTPEERQRIIDAQIAAGHFDRPLRDARMVKMYNGFINSGLSSRKARKKIQQAYSYLSDTYIRRIVFTHDTKTDNAL